MARQGRYHHGDLPNMLVRAANDILEEDGVAALSLRGVARKAGVSQAAPYHHFKDHQALLGAVATQGHVELLRSSLAFIGDETDKLERLRRTGLAYVLFAHDHPQQFHLMFGRELLHYHEREHVQAAVDNYMKLRRTLGDYLGLDPDLPDDRLDRAVLIAWSTVHGLAMLVVEDRVVYPKDDREAFIKFARQVLGIVDFKKVLEVEG